MYDFYRQQSNVEETVSQIATRWLLFTGPQTSMTAGFSKILESLLQVNENFSVVFPVHPRTRQRLSEFKLNAGKLHLLEPLPYIEFLAMQSHAAVVITDSGGIQEETTYLGVPCLTLRNNTERPITVTLGTNVIVGQDREKLHAELLRIIGGRPKRGSIPPLWDGHAGERIADILHGLSN